MNTIKRVTEGQVHQAMLALDAEGLKASVQSIRDRIGSGSFSTIAKYMKTYDPEALDGPAEIPEPPEGASSAIWAIAYARAYAYLDEIVQAERRRADQAEAQAAEYLDGLDDQAAKIARLEKRHEDQADQLAKAAGALERANEANARLDAKLESALERLKEVEAERDRLFNMVQSRLDLDDKQPAKARKRPAKAAPSAKAPTPDVSDLID